MNHANGAQSNGHRGDERPPLPAAVDPPVAPPAAAPVPAPRQAAPAGAIDGERARDVMAGHNELMQRFLDAHTSVMLAYLGQRRGAPEHEPAAPPAARALERPPASAVPVPAPDGAASPAMDTQSAAPGGATLDVTEAASTSAPLAGAASAPPPAAPVRGPSEAGNIAGRLLTVVSERTGYPPDLLDLDADLEADLGIDSIKRVEIAGTMMEDPAMPDGVELDVEELTASRTLREVIAVLERLAGAGAAAAHAPPPAGTDATPVGAGDPADAGHGRVDAAVAYDAAADGSGDAVQEAHPVPFEDEPVDGRIGRFVLQTAGAPAVSRNARLDRDGLVVIVDGATGVGEALAQRLSADGRRAVVVPPVEPSGAATLVEDIRARHGDVCALVYLAGLGPGDPPDAGELLALLQALREDLEQAGAAGGGAVLGATRMGGAFAVAAAPADLDPRVAVVPGFLKSLAHEWPGVRVKAVDFDGADPATVAGRLFDELHADDGLVEVGYRGDERVTPRLLPDQETGLDGEAADPEAAPLDRDAVVLLTGGARGITAEIAVDLARRYGSTLVLAGRTPLPPEDDDDADPEDERALQQAIIERRRSAGEVLTPRAVGEEVRSRLAEREVRQTLRRVRDAGARVRYVVCDVQHPHAVAELVEGIYAEHGRLDAVLHGAGVIEDRLIRDKDLESLRRVLATKADAAIALTERLRPDGLRFLVLFSSVSARFGNRGQADYAAASEVLNKLAQQLDRRWDARVVAINWGPWAETGMVRPEVARQFTERGVALIAPAIGCARLDEELRLGRKGEVEVLIGGDSAGMTAPRPAPRPTAAFLRGPRTLARSEDSRLEAICRLDPERDPLLDDHRLDGTAVLPFTGAMELMAETALAANPGLELVELRDVRLQDGVTADASGVTVRVTASTPEIGARDDDAPLAVSVTIDTAEARRAHYRATALLGRRLSDAPTPPTEPLADLDPSPVSARRAYEEYLFHGPTLRRIEAIDGLDVRGAVARLSASAPADVLDGCESEATWILDPVLLDCALQMQLLWSRVHWDLTLLPVQAAAVRRYAAAPSPGVSIRHELRVRPSRPPLCVADHRFTTAEGKLVLEIEGMQGVGSHALNRLAGASA
jgi:NAD(P)-dependent dehydrogenase (short-subunit alcohol dehydrogenase family)